MKSTNPVLPFNFGIHLVAMSQNLDNLMRSPRAGPFASMRYSGDKTSVLRWIESLSIALASWMGRG